MLDLINDDCTKVLNQILEQNENSIIVSDPPFNIKYKYSTYKDNLKEEDYLNMIETVFNKKFPLVIIHYPEMLHKISCKLGIFPEKIVSWVYNSNTQKQHRDIAFYNVHPDFSKVRQPYKNPNDKRVQKLMQKGAGGG